MDNNNEVAVDFNISADIHGNNNISVMFVMCLMLINETVANKLAAAAKQVNFFSVLGECNNSNNGSNNNENNKLLLGNKFVAGLHAKYDKALDMEVYNGNNHVGIEMDLCSVNMGGNEYRRNNAGFYWAGLFPVEARNASVYDSYNTYYQVDTGVDRLDNGRFISKGIG